MRTCSVVAVVLSVVGSFTAAAEDRDISWIRSEYRVVREVIENYSKTEEFIAGKGVVAKWERVRRNNHWFDAIYNASAAGHACGVRLFKKKPKQHRPTRKPPKRPPFVRKLKRRRLIDSIRRRGKR